MKLHRFFIGDVELDDSLSILDQRLLHQWTKVLRFRMGRKVSLFNSERLERLYTLESLDKRKAQLTVASEVAPQLSAHDLTLCFALMKKDKNNWVLQKATELGVSRFAPVITARTEKTGFDLERAQKIVIEAAEQCGRTDMPTVDEPVSLAHRVAEISAAQSTDSYVAEQGSSSILPQDIWEGHHSVAVFVGPEGGWTDDEKVMLSSEGVAGLAVGAFTLRAETASVACAAVLLQGL